MSAPIGNTCPDIDKLLKRINSLRSDAKYHRNNGDKDFSDFADNVYDEMWHISNELEGLRSSNSELREWGKEMEELAESLQVDVNTLQEQYNSIT